MDSQKDNSYDNYSATVTITQPNHPILVNVASPLLDVDTTTTYTIQNTDAEILATYTDGKPVIATRSINTGHVVLIGYDYADYEDKTAKLLSNALQWSASNQQDSNDNDFDNDGVETDVDCNDQDNSASVHIYKDEDSDGLGDPTTGMCAAEQEGYVTNSDDPNDTIPNIRNAENITSVKGATKGRIAVKLQDGTVYHYQVFAPKGERKTHVKRIDQHTVAVVQAKGKSVALVDYLNGTIYSKKKLSGKGYGKIELRTPTMQKHRALVVVASDKTHGTQLSTFMIRVNKLKLKAHSTVRNKYRVAPGKTSIHHNTILLNNTQKQTIGSYRLNKHWKLVPKQ